MSHLDHEQKFMLAIERQNMAMESLEKAVGFVGTAVRDIEKATSAQRLASETTAEAMKQMGEHLAKAATAISESRTNIELIRTSQDKTVETLVKWIQKLAVFTVVLILVLILSTGGKPYIAEAVELLKNIF